MAIQYSAALRNAQLDAVSTQLGAGFTVKFFSGAPPATVATADSGTLLATFTGCNYAAASGGAKALSATATATASAAGTIGYYRAYTSGGTCVMQGVAAQGSVALTTSALTAAGNGVLTFTAVSGVTLGMNASGTGIPAGATVAAFSGTTVTLSTPSTAGVASGASITFSPDMVLDNATVAASQTVNLNSLGLTAANA